MRPTSSRDKKVFKWDSDEKRFTMDERHKDELKKYHITNEGQWQEFEALFENFPVADHPELRSRSCLMGTLLWTVCGTLLIGLLYLLYVLLQYALFNPIIAVVFLISWSKLCGVFNKVIANMLDKGRKKKFKAYFKKIKELEWLEKLPIEVQEDEEGQWVEISLNITADERKKQK